MLLVAGIRETWNTEASIRRPCKRSSGSGRLKKGTNNIGEFLALVHGLALLKQKGFDMPIYSDSVNAISWIKQKKCKTKLPREPKTEELFKLIERAEKWLRENTYTTKILKWETKQWGEIPADFGRK